MDEFPAKLEELFHFSFNFDNLIKIIQFLHKNNIQMSSDIKELSHQISTIDDLKQQISDMQIKLKSHDKSIKDVNESISNHQTKLLEIDQKIGVIAQETVESNTKIGQFEFKLSAHDENLNNLNRVVEDHIKTARESDNKIEEMSTNLLDNTLKLDKLSTKLQSIQTEQNDKNIQLQKNVDSLSADIFELKTSYDKKTVEIDKTFTNLITSISEVTSKVNEGGHSRTKIGKKTSIKSTPVDNIEISNGNSSSVQLAMGEIEKLQTKIEMMTKTMNEQKEINEKENKEIKSSIDQMKQKMNEINEAIDNIELDHSSTPASTLPRKSLSYGGSSKNLATNSNLENIVNEAAINAVINSEQFHKLSENLRIISNSIGNKANKDEIEVLNRNLLSKIEKLSDKVNENLKFYDSKFKNFKSSNDNSSSSSQNQNFDFNFFAQNLETQINEQIRSLSTEIISKSIPQLDISQNAQIKEMTDVLAKHTDELNETYKSIVDIRKCLVSNELIDEIQNLKSRVEGTEEENRRIKFRVTELSKNIEGEEEEEANPMGMVAEQPHANVGGTFREKMNILTSTCQSLNDKVAILEKKNAALSKEVKDDIKASLKNETSKVIDQFKVKLESFTNRFEHELKNKIDLMGLSSFEHKINNKLYVEMRDKLDKNDLKKNNNTINRKIDSLENKISKTLVDTIIDLQMDEAPLIVKKNMKNIEKCASCNQVLPQTNAMYYSTDKFRSTKYNIKEKLPDILEK